MVTEYNVAVDEKLLGVTALLEQPYEDNNWTIGALQYGVPIVFHTWEHLKQTILV